MARLRALLRRPPGEVAPTRGVIGGHEVDVTAATVTGPGGRVRLTPTEWRILALLVASPGRLVPGRQILHEVRGPGQEERSNYLWVYFAGLRRKLNPTRPGPGT
ncbi:winged helix-turn-helix domain-containing protein [Kitasatospora sp. NBC_00315]